MLHALEEISRKGRIFFRRIARVLESIVRKAWKIKLKGTRSNPPSVVFSFSFCETLNPCQTVLPSKFTHAAVHRTSSLLREFEREWLRERERVWERVRVRERELSPAAGGSSLPLKSEDRENRRLLGQDLTLKCFVKIYSFQTHFPTEIFLRCKGSHLSDEEK